ncbi:uncharacterized protein LOC119833035 [Zerene cesonia]|uniref:uncharacterized protein LOC119833035 n=1 Tax=Zerene cesonia TaxID=33412 RepID=UPI0018E59B1E|nr:uncharacterized protein LOC119833035 [Zerene cesonia]
MKNICMDFLEQLSDIYKFPPLRYLLELDVMDLSDKFPDLGLFLVDEPLKFNKICNEILFACLRSIDNDYKQFIQSSQVAVTIRLKSLPRVLSRSTSRRYAGIVSFYGLLLAISKLTCYVFHTVWSCPEECEGNEIVLHYIPKIPPKCYVCKSVLFENSGLRRCGEQVEATFKLENVILCKKFVITDDLISTLSLGDTYVINAVILKKTAAVWSLEKHIPWAAPHTCSTPADIKDLYTACDDIPWKFIYCLASSIGIHVCPLNCFINVKINLLLSLTSVKAHLHSGSRILHFLGAGYDTSYVGKLMHEAAVLADGHVEFGTSNMSVTTSLIAASGSICLLPLPLQIYGQKHINSILSSIETGDIPSENCKTTLKCAVWAHGMDFKKITLYNIASVFGLVCRGDLGEFADDISDFILQEAITPSETTAEETRALKDVKEHIDLVAGIVVNLSQESENLLQNYFLAARKERPKAVTVACMSALVTICLTSARLCRRNETNIEDAVFSIWLHVCGGPEPRFAPDEYLETPADMKKLHKVINSFKTWLEQFTGVFI